MRLFIFTFLLLLSFGSTRAQGFYVQLKTGYAVPIATDDLGSPLPELGDGDFFRDENGNISDKSLYGTLGRAFVTEVGLGYGINENLAVEVSFLYTMGPEFLEARRETPQYFAEQYGATRGFGLSSALVVQGNTKLQPYAKFGLTVPVGGHIKTKVSLRDQEEITLCRLTPCTGGVSPFPQAELDVSLNAEAKTNARPAIGFIGGFGLRYPLGEHFSIFGEAAITVLSLKTKRSEYTRYDETATGNLSPGIAIDLSRSLDDLNEYEKLINYSDELTENSNNAEYNADYDVNLPMDDRSQKSNASNLALLIGVKYAF